MNELVHRIHIHAATFAVKPHVAIDQRENRVIAAKTHVFAGMPLGSALTDDDIARDNFFAAELLHTATLAVTVASVFNTSLSLLMSHVEKI